MHKRETRENIAAPHGDAQAALDAQVLEIMKHQEAALAHGKLLPAQCSLDDLRARTRSIRAEAALARARTNGRRATSALPTCSWSAPNAPRDPSRGALGRVTSR